MKNYLILGFFLSFIACENLQPNTEPLYKSISFQPNQCDEPWDAAAFAADTRIESMQKYLITKGISGIFNVEVTPVEGVFCQACTCPSSNVYKFDVLSSEFEKLNQIPPFDTLLNDE